METSVSSRPLTPAWTTFRPHAIQSRLWRTRARFVAACAGRGSGKTALSFRRLVRFLPIRKPWDNPQYFYGAPTREQAKRLAWDELKLLIPPNWIKGRPNETELVIDTVFGSSLHLVSLEKPERIEGTQWDGGVLDESSDGRPGIFARSIVPALTHKNGWCWRIGVPKRHGPGAREFKEFFDRGLLGIDPLQESYTWPSWDILSAEQIEEARTQLGTIDFEEQFGGNWQSPEGQIYYGFSRERNVDDSVVYNPNEKIYVGSDFNVSPMAWTLAHKVDGRALVFDELYIMNTNTPKTLDALYARYPNHKAGWRFCGDATSKARKTAATHSDYVLIKNDIRFENKEVRYPDSNPAIGDRFACVNANCSNARVVINSKCRNLLDDLEACAYKEGSKEQDKSNKFEGHITDALGYFLVREFPIRLRLNDNQKGIGVVMSNA